MCKNFRPCQALMGIASCGAVSSTSSMSSCRRFNTTSQCSTRVPVPPTMRSRFKYLLSLVIRSFILMVAPIRADDLSWIIHLPSHLPTWLMQPFRGLVMKILAGNFEYIVCKGSARYDEPVFISPLGLNEEVQLACVLEENLEKVKRPLSGQKRYQWTFGLLHYYRPFVICMGPKRGEEVMQ